MSNYFSSVSKNQIFQTVKDSSSDVSFNKGMFVGLSEEGILFSRNSGSMTVVGNDFETEEK